ncbi:hypothetical protein [Streptomyces sp. NBC_00354]|uniref:hypothetical protein n=1 Tax=Streptomyces sp. NBC_00354 TaxID=2975723 RepID=UPI002E2755D8
MPRASGGQVLAHLPGLLRPQRDRPADRAQAARLIVAAEDEELRPGEGAGWASTASRRAVCAMRCS